MANKIDLSNGEYTVINELGNGGGFRALRHGEEWRDLAGDNLILSMYHEIEDVHDRLTKAESLLSRAYSVLDDVHCSETKVARQISEYLYGEDD